MCGDRISIWQVVSLWCLVLRINLGMPTECSDVAICKDKTKEKAGLGPRFAKAKENGKENGLATYQSNVSR
jgi:hypothetical protein